jgi:hypothetical protein
MSTTRVVGKTAKKAGVSMYKAFSAGAKTVKKSANDYQKKRAERRRRGHIGD